MALPSPIGKCFVAQYLKRGATAEPARWAPKCGWWSGPMARSRPCAYCCVVVETSVQLGQMEIDRAPAEAQTRVFEAAVAALAEPI